MANIHDITRDAFMLCGPPARKDYDWWCYSLTAENAETCEKKPFYIEFFTCNPARAKLDTCIRCFKKDLLNINYAAPTGFKRHNRFRNGGPGTDVLKLSKRGLFGREKLIDEIEAIGIGCEYGEYNR